MIIGVTGNSGSGKTEVSNKLKEKLGCYLVIADEIVKELSQKGNKYYDEIVKAFGTSILNKLKEIDRPKLAKKIYNNSEKREILNSITNIYIVEEIKKQANRVSNEGTVIIDVPRLIECGLSKICNVIISVIADTEIKIDRICKRDNISREIAESRLNIQPNDQFYIDNSDYIINTNNGVLDEAIDSVIEGIKCNI